MDEQQISNVNTISKEKRCYTVLELAQILNISRTSAYQLVKNSPFKVIRIGTSIRISKASFDEWLDDSNL